MGREKKKEKKKRKERNIILIGGLIKYLFFALELVVLKIAIWLFSTTNNNALISF